MRRSKRNVNVADVDSLEKAEKRVAIKNLEETQGYFQRTYWTRSWSLLLKEKDRHTMKMRCTTIEIVVMKVFVRHDWRFSNRLAF